MNRIKIQVILLILQLETDYFSSYSFQKCSIRSSGTTVFTETSRTAILHEEVLQDSSTPILQGYPYNLHTHTIIHRSREFSIQNPILHAEDKELFEYYYYYMQRAKRPSFQKRNSMHRRQGDLLEIHLCVLQDLPKTFQAFQPRDLPKAFQTLTKFSRHSSRSRPSKSFQTFQSFKTFQPDPGNSTNSTNSTSSSISRESTPFQHSPIRMHILQFYSSIEFPQKTPTEYQLITLQTLANIHINYTPLRMGACCEILIKTGESVKMIKSAHGFFSMNRMDFLQMTFQVKRLIVQYDHSIVSEDV